MGGNGVVLGQVSKSVNGRFNCPSFLGCQHFSDFGLCAYLEILAGGINVPGVIFFFVCF